MAVADRALAGEAHPCVRHRRRAVDGVAEEQLVVDRASLACCDVAPGEAGGNLLIGRDVRQQVASDLKNRELVEGEILVERLHDPVAVQPHLTFVVEMKAMRVAVTSVVEPVAGHLLAVVRALQQPRHQLLVGVGRTVGDEGIDLVRCRRQAGEGKRQPSDERGPVGLGIDREPLG